MAKKWVRMERVACAAAATTALAANPSSAMMAPGQISLVCRTGAIVIAARMKARCASAATVLRFNLAGTWRAGLMPVHTLVQRHRTASVESVSATMCVRTGVKVACVVIAPRTTIEAVVTVSCA